MSITEFMFWFQGDYLVSRLFREECRFRTLAAEIIEESNGYLGLIIIPQEGGCRSKSR